MFMNKLISLILSFSLLGISGCGTSSSPEQTQTPTEKPTETQTAELPTEENIKISITLTDGRVMKGELYPDIAPGSVENFVKLINENFFDGLIFHRVIPGFMIQGGGYDDTFYKKNFNSKETASIKGEFASNGFENNLKHTRGVLSMARTQDPDSASSQFFIMHQDAPYLDGEYAAFGKITEGLEVVDEIANVKTTALEGTVLVNGMQYPTQMSDVPEQPIIIKTIDIIE